MAFLVITLLLAGALLALERIFHLAHRGRIVLGSIVSAWAFVDGIWSARANPEHLIGAFFASFLESVAPLVLWQWVSSWIRESADRRPKVLGSSSGDPLTPSGDLGASRGVNLNAKDILVEPPIASENPLNRHWTGGVVTVAIDSAKLLFPAYVADPLGADRDTTVAATLVRDGVLNKILATVPVTGKEMVLVCVGSPGSGKTSTLFSNSDPTVGLKIEETLDDLERARELVQGIIDSGRIPVILWMYVDDVGKTVERMFRRAIGTPERPGIGRTDQLDYMTDAYFNVPQVLEALGTEFSGRLKICVADNSGLRGEIKLIPDEARVGTMQEDALATRVGLAQVDATNRMFRENPDFEVPY